MKNMKNRNSQIHRTLLPPLAVAGAILLWLAGSAHPARAASGNWNINAGGYWATTANWSPAAVPGTAVGDTVGLTYNITGNWFITNNTAVTLGVLNLGDADNSNTYTLTNNAGNTFTFDNSGNGAQLNEVATSKGDTLLLPVSLNDNLTITNASTNTLTLAGVISGTGSQSVAIYNTTNGTVTLSGANTYSGGTTVGGSGGTFKLGVSSVYSSPSITSGATGSGNLTLGSGVNVNNASGVTWDVPTLTLNGDITLIGGNRLTVSFTNLNLGGGSPRKIYVNSKSLAIISTNTVSPSSWSPNNSSGTGNTDNTGISSWEISSTLGGLTVQNGSLDLETTAYSGTNYGAFRFSSGTGFMSFPGNSSVTVGPNVVLLLNGSFNGTYDPSLTISAGGYVDGLDAANTLYTLAGGGTYSLSLISTATTAKTLTINGASGSANFSGTLQDGPGGAQLALTKSGASLQTLSGTNTYSGATTVSGGALLINGTNAVYVGSTAAYTVSSGGTLGGNGRIDLSAVNLGVTVNSGGVLSPGAAAGQAGTLTLALGTGVLNLSGALATAGTLAFDLGAIGSSDEIVLPSGTLNIGSGVLNWNSFNFNSLGGLQTGTYTLISTPNAITGSLGSSLTGVIGAYNGTLSLSGDTKSLLLTLSVPALPVPSFSNLTPSQTIGAGMSSLILTGKVYSATGPTYPTNGESGTVSATINGTQTFGTFTDGVGDFSINFNPSALTVASSPYVITYSYAGDGRLSAAANNTSTAITVTTNIVWTGAVSPNFETGGNWNTASAPANDLVTDLASFNGAVTANQPALTTSRSVSGLSFATATGGWTLSGTANNVLALGVNGVSSVGQTSGSNLIAAAVSVATNQTWKAGTGGSLIFTGSITNDAGDTNCSSLTINASGSTGNVILSPSVGNSIVMVGTNNFSSLIQVKTGGLLELGGNGTSAPLTTSSNTLFNVESGSTYGTWGINGLGVVQVNSGTWSCGDLGKNGGDRFTGLLDVNGGTLELAGARYLGEGTINVSGGKLAVTCQGALLSNGGRFSLGSVYSAITNTAAMSVTGGFVDLAQADGGNSIGGAIGTLLNLSGGTLQNGVTVGGGNNGGTATTFTIGSGVANDFSAVTLTGGTFISAGTVAAAGAAGSPGANNFNFMGGTLAVAGLNATYLGSCASATATANQTNSSDNLGTLVNYGGTLAPGGSGTPGQTIITGGYTISNNAAVLAIDLGGTTRASSFQASTNGYYDYLQVSGPIVLGGTLQVSLVGGYVPAATDQLNIIASSGAGNWITGTFTNLNRTGANGGYLGRVTVANMTNASFQVIINSETNTLYLYNFQVAGSTTAVAPTNVVAQVVNVSGTNSVVISGSGGSGSSYTVLTATNLTTPVADWMTNATALPFGTGGSVNYTNPINSALPQQFYRVRVP